MKINPILKTIYGIFFIFFVMSSLLAVVSTIGFWIIYLSMTHPILAEYQTQLTFRIGMVNVAFGIGFAHVIIILKSMDYVFGVSENKLRENKK